MVHRLIVLSFTFFLLLIGNLVASDGVGWQPEPFESPVEEVFAAADELDLDIEDAAAAVMFEEVSYRFDAEGRQSRTRTLVFRYLTDLGVDEWDTVSTRWQPWHQERPVFKARVLTPEGTVVFLDPDTISESPDDSSGEDVFDDRRHLEAPLPLAKVGCIVEERVTVKESQARFPGGTKSFFSPSWSVPAYHTRLVVEVDDALELSWIAYELDDVEPTVESIDGATRYSFDFHKPEKGSDVESNLPFDQPRKPYIAFSTGESWTAIAAEYSMVVDEQIASADASTFPEIPDTAPKLELIQAALDWVHLKVRYTGLEFGRSSIVPYSPDQTVSRGYGDCKDQATLLVTLLRRWGIHADVALLRSGYGFDTDPELPAVGAFNHAIVYIPGASPLWIDPTSEYHRVGTIPAADCDRRALVANPETAGLQKTPQIRSEDSGIKETRVFHLAEEGDARLTLVVEPWGGSEVHYRNWYVARTEEKRRESMDSWVQRIFLAEELGELEFSDPNALGESFTMRLTAEKARRGFTGYGDAVVAFRYDEILSGFPDALTDESDEERTEDYVFSRPFQKELHYRAVPPTGFVAADLPENQVTELGSARLEESFSLTDDGIIEAVIAVDSGPRSISAEEFEATREALSDLKKRDYTAFYFVHLGQYLLGQGKTAEGLAELARLVEEEPEVALHQVRLAQGLIDVGLGEEARAAARNAVQMNPEGILGHKTLSWVLQHDLVGRQYGPGFDHAGAVAAYRQAKEMEDADLHLAFNFAVLLEHDASGRRYSERADMDSAISTYLEAKEEYPDEFTYDHNLVVAMLWDRRYEELVELFPDLGETDEEKSVVLTAIAATQGVEEAHRRIRLEYREADMVRRLLFEIGQLLGQQRFYKESGAAFRLAAQGAEDSTAVLAQAFMMDRTRRVEDLDFEQSSPDGVIRQTYIFSGNPDGGEKIRAQLLCDLVKDNFELEDLESAGMNFAEDLEKIARQSNLPTRVLVDLTLGSVEFIVEGSKSDVRRVHLRSLADGQSDSVMFVKEEGKSYKLLATAQDLSSLGYVALSLLREDNPEGAREILDWARDLTSSYDSGDPLDSVPFADIWRRVGNQSSEEIKKAALILAAGGPLSELIQSDLELVIKEEPEAEWRDQLLLSLISVYLATEDYERVVEIADVLDREHPDSWVPIALKGGALMELRRYDDALEAAETLMVRRPEDIMAMRLLSNAVEMTGDVERAIDLLTKVVSSSEAVPMDFNNRAWLALFRDTIEDQAFQWAQSAVKRAEGMDGDFAALHTLATLYAQKDMPAEAYQIIVKAMDVFEEPQSVDWIVFGRMAETYGFSEAARSAYQRVIDGEEHDHFISTAALARRRLAIMNTAGEQTEEPVS